MKEEKMKIEEINGQLSYRIKDLEEVNNEYKINIQNL